MRELANEEGATRKASVERLLVYSTLPKVRAAQAVVARRAINFGKVCAVKVIHLSYRKKTNKFGRGEGGFLVKKGRKMGVVSL